MTGEPTVVMTKTKQLAYSREILNGTGYEVQTLGSAVPK